MKYTKFKPIQIRRWGNIFNKIADLLDSAHTTVDPLETNSTNFLSFNNIHLGLFWTYILIYCSVGEYCSIIILYLIILVYCSVGEYCYIIILYLIILIYCSVGESCSIIVFIIRFHPKTHCKLNNKDESNFF